MGTFFADLYFSLATAVQLCCSSMCFGSRVVDSTIVLFVDSKWYGFHYHLIMGLIEISFILLINFSCDE